MLKNIWFLSIHHVIYTAVLNYTSHAVAWLRLLLVPNKNSFLRIKYILIEANRKKEWKAAWNSLINVKMFFVNDKEKERKRESKLFYYLWRERSTRDLILNFLMNFAWIDAYIEVCNAFRICEKHLNLCAKTLMTLFYIYIYIYI